MTMLQQTARPVPAYGKTLVKATGLSKRYGSTHALSSVDVSVAAGEILGLVGHNGAGKSTLMRALAGREAADAGQIDWHGGGPWNQRTAERNGVRMVYQELALCPDLTISENIALSSPTATGLRWRARAERVLVETLDHVFPDHGINIMRLAGDLPMPQRQMVEIARALCTPNLTLLILDEPTESLSLDATRQMYRALRELAARGVGMVLISHRMQEVLEHTDRIAVMRDGRVVEIVETGDTSEERLLVAMGGEVRADTATMHRIEDADSGGAFTRREVAATQAFELPFSVASGEIVGLAGLAGHGQERLLHRLWSGGRGIAVAARRAYVPGDRQSSGVFPLWSVAENVTISATRELSTFGVISAAERKSVAEDWVQRLHVKGGSRASITALSGGNQQKVLVARAFASDAPLVLLDDPFRGVDVKTKNELYALMRVEASRGRSIVWYSTENGEMAHCDRVYVFRSGAIVSEITDTEITEERIIADSFGADPRSSEEQR